jgi:hypothetical protein
MIMKRKRARKENGKFVSGWVVLFRCGVSSCKTMTFGSWARYCLKLDYLVVFASIRFHLGVRSVLRYGIAFIQKEA